MSSTDQEPDAIGLDACLKGDACLARGDACLARGDACLAKADVCLATNIYWLCLGADRGCCRSPTDGSSSTGGGTTGLLGSCCRIDCSRLTIRVAVMNPPGTFDMATGTVTLDPGEGAKRGVVDPTGTVTLDPPGAFDIATGIVTLEPGEVAPRGVVGRTAKAGTDVRALRGLQKPSALDTPPPPCAKAGTDIGTLWGLRKPSALDIPPPSAKAGTDIGTLRGL